ncbi:MAG: DNA methyltransferase [Candidatus Gracilibacteria bacterium]|nr:DNA methyltransferase [Candidatus Gracilibacteria bacterium]
MSKNLQIKPGDLFALGSHRILCADATFAEAVKKLIGKDKVNLILTDVPYGVDFAASKKDFIKTREIHKDIVGDHLQSDKEFSTFTRKWLAAIKPHLAKHNAYYVFNGDKMIFAMREGFIAEGFKLSQLLVWIKTGAVIGRLDYLPQHELIAYGWYGRHTFHKSVDRSVIICPKTQKNIWHPTSKPLPILRRLILNSTKVGDVVYDCFLGGGSTLIACEDTKRCCFGVEVDPEYIRATIQRFEQKTGLQAKLVSNSLQSCPVNPA